MVRSDKVIQVLAIRHTLFLDPMDFLIFSHKRDQLVEDELVHDDDDRFDVMISFGWGMIKSILRLSISFLRDGNPREKCRRPLTVDIFL